MDSYFQVRDAERTAWFTSQEVRNIADVAAMVTKALDAAGGEGETSVQALADHGGISLRPISADRFSAQVRDLFCEPPGKLLAELDLKDDTFYCASWVPREEHCVAVSGMISRLLGVYELAMVERLEKHLDLDRFCNEIWDHLHVSFVAPRMERQSERWGPRDRPETGRGALYKRAADLVATYEELLLVPDEACVTHYLGDLGIHIFKYDAAQEQIQNAYEKALSVMEMDDAEFQAEKQFVYRGEIISAMRDRLLVGELKPGETVLFVGTEPYGGPGDFELRGGVVEAVNPSERTCSVRGEFFTMHVVSESTTGFMDGQYFKDACMKSEFSDLEHEMVLDEILEENQERWGIRCAAGISPDGSYSAALFTVPSGVYYWYWGKDQKGKICCLVADFFTYL